MRAVSANRLIKVGVAEDHPLARQGLVQLLETTDDIVVTAQATDGDETLALIHREEMPDVILLDLRMPGVDGLEVTRRIAEQNPSVGIVILTATDDTRAVTRAVRAGAKGYVLKTANGDEVIETVRMVARGHVVIDARAWRALSEEEASGAGDQALSRRELQVIQEMASGRTNRQIGERLGISHETVKTHVERILKRLEASDRTEAVVKAIRAGIIE